VFVSELGGLFLGVGSTQRGQRRPTRTHAVRGQSPIQAITGLGVEQPVDPDQLVSRYIELSL